MLVFKLIRPNFWAALYLVGIKTGITTGFMPTEYYSYYPFIKEAQKSGLYIRKFKTLLLYKEKDIVVTGRTVHWNGTKIVYSEKVGRPKEPVHGIIPKNAKDGFWYYNGKKWEHCEEVEIRPMPDQDNIEELDNTRFVGLRTESGQLVPSQERLLTLLTWN